MDILKTLGRGSRAQPQGRYETLLSGIMLVTLNQKPPQSKFVEVAHNAVEKKTALYIHKTRDKVKRTEAAIDLAQATVFIEYDTPNTVGIINRDNRIYTLKLDKDKEELERFVAQWRSVLTVSQHPDDMFSVITVSGEDRGSVILIVAYNHEDSIVFKHMSGLRKNSEFRISQFFKVEKLSAHEVAIESASGETYHFISKRPDDLLRKLKLKHVDDLSFTQRLPTKSISNDSSHYDSRAGYTPTFQMTREVTTAPDYLTRDQINPGPPRPDSRLNPSLPPDRPVSPSFPRRQAPPPPARPGSTYSVPTVHVDGARVPPARPEYTPMDHPSRIEPKDDYMSMDQNQQAEPRAHPDYMPMDHPSWTEPQDDYMTMDENQQAERPQDDYIAMDQMGPGITSDPDYSIMDNGYQDPLIADYLTMDDMENCQSKFDDYPSHERPPEVDGSFEDDEDIYFDPSLAPPPVPPRIEDCKPAPAPVPLPPRPDDRPNLSNKSSLVAEVEIRPRPDVSPCRVPARQPPPSPSVPARRFSDQPQHLPRPKSGEFTAHKVEPALPPRTINDQLMVRPKVDPTKKKKKKKRPKSNVYPADVNFSASAESPFLHDRTTRAPAPNPQKSAVVPPPLVPRKM